MTDSNKPYDTLGQHLKTVREQSKKSLAEVSGAIEIDENELKNIEAGISRPDEDIMLLLISYFDLVDQEALHVWELADYDSPLEEHMDFDTIDTTESSSNNPQIAKPLLMFLSMEPRTMYTDSVEVSWNKSGVTMDFSQVTPKGQLSVAKVGMSIEQAAEVLKCLERAMLHSKYGTNKKLLPPKQEPEK